MKAKVTKIDPPKISRTQGEFIRIYFQGEDRQWYQTDVVTSYRNYKNWKPIISSGVGTLVDGLKTKNTFNKSKIDGDSPVTIIRLPEDYHEPENEHLFKKEPENEKLF